MFAFFLFSWRTSLVHGLSALRGVRAYRSGYRLNHIGFLSCQELQAWPGGARSRWCTIEPRYGGLGIVYTAKRTQIIRSICMCNV
jgi:hypothetical protein